MRFVAAMIAGLVLLVAAANAQERVNVVLVVNDDQGYGDASCFGATDLKTPHFDALAAGGMRFTKFRVMPLCAPTRACVMTGLSSLEAGMWRGPSQKEGSDRVIQKGVKLLPQYLKDA